MFAIPIEPAARNLFFGFIFVLCVVLLLAGVAGAQIAIGAIRNARDASRDR